MAIIGERGGGGGGGSGGIIVVVSPGNVISPREKKGERSGESTAGSLKLKKDLMFQNKNVESATLKV